jgi:acyl-CoA thioester hydrolase
VDIHYKRPARLGEIIEVTTEMIEMTHAAITLKHQIFRDDTLLVEADVKIACIDKDGRPRRLPDSLRIHMNV